MNIFVWNVKKSKEERELFYYLYKTEANNTNWPNIKEIPN